jgi:hypothetical protein
LVARLPRGASAGPPGPATAPLGFAADAAGLPLRLYGPDGPLEPGRAGAAQAAATGAVAAAGTAVAAVVMGTVAVAEATRLAASTLKSALTGGSASGGSLLPGRGSDADLLDAAGPCPAGAVVASGCPAGHGGLLQAVADSGPGPAPGSPRDLLADEEEGAGEAGAPLTAAVSLGRSQSAHASLPLAALDSPRAAAAGAAEMCAATASVGGAAGGGEVAASAALLGVAALRSGGDDDTAAEAEREVPAPLPLPLPLRRAHSSQAMFTMARAEGEGPSGRLGSAVSLRGLLPSAGGSVPSLPGLHRGASRGGLAHSGPEAVCSSGAGEPQQQQQQQQQQQHSHHKHHHHHHQQQKQREAQVTAAASLPADAPRSRSAGPPHTSGYPPLPPNGSGTAALRGSESGGGGSAATSLGGAKGAREPYNLRVVAHSLGGASMLMYLVMRLRSGRAHHVQRLVLLTPAGFHVIVSAPGRGLGRVCVLGGV